MYLWGEFLRSSEWEMTWALSRSTLDVRMFCVVEQDYLEM